MIHKVQIDDLVRDATPDETARIEQAQAEAKAAAEAVADAIATRASALAKLKVLGLTDDEIAALIGA